jgi:hypothetical protein
MTSTSDRLVLPFIAPGQAQKEMTHNEALALVDMLVQPVVQAIAPAAVPASPALGQCWIVGASANGAWLGHDDALACWTSGGWRFVSAFEGMSVWSVADQMTAVRQGAVWMVGEVNARHIRINNLQTLGARQPAIPSPNGGAIIDGESRSAIGAILGVMRTHGLIST